MSDHLGAWAILRQKLYEVLEDEEWPHPVSRWVHNGLAAFIVISVAAAVLETVPSIRSRWDFWLSLAEYACVLLFTLEYAVRVWICVEDRAGRYDHSLWGRLRYMATPMAVIDLLAILPTYLALIL